MNEPAGAKKKVLLVEDDEFLRSLVVERLMQSGYDVQVAKDGTEALAQVKQHPDLIMLDLVLPGFGGFELMAKIRQQAEAKNIPFIVLSNSEEQENRKQSQELHAVGYLIKAQSTPAEIVAAVDAFFNAPHTPGA